MARRRKCLNPNCKSKKPAKYRGLCINCYHCAYRRVRLEQTTWEELYKLKLALPDARQAGFGEALANAK